MPEGYFDGWDGDNLERFKADVKEAKANLVAMVRADLNKDVSDKELVTLVGMLSPREMAHTLFAMTTFLSTVIRETQHADVDWDGTLTDYLMNDPLDSGDDQQ